MVTTRRDLEAEIRSRVDGHPDIIDAVISEIVSEVSRYEDVDVSAISADAYERIIRRQQEADELAAELMAFVRRISR
jgi:hypothetical protein